MAVCNTVAREIVRPQVAPRRATLPIVVLDSDDEVVVRASMPGCDKDEIDISFREGRLTLRGCVKSPVRGRVHVHERAQHGEVARTVLIKAAVDVERAAASYVDGVLTLTLPKAASAKVRRIYVA